MLLCSQLQRLSLYSCGFDLTADNSAFCSSISTATGLTSLHINKCRLMVDMEDLDDKFGISQPDTHLLLLALTSLTALQELSVCGAAVFCNSQPASDYNDPPAHLPLNITVLQPLQHLTQLHLQLQTRGCIGGEWPRGVERMLQHIGTMTDLQDLRLGCNTWERDYYDLDVAPLTSLTKLRSLGLRGVDLKNVGPPGSAAEAGANVAALLAWVAKLQGLSSLQLRTVAGLVPYHQEHQEFWPPATAYNALTASSALQHIDLLFADISQKAAWRHIFPRDDWSPDATLKGKFTNITSLRFGPHLDGFTAPAQRKPVGYFLDAVAGSCSNLQELQACDFEDMGPLQHHTSLTRLTLTMKYAEDCDVDVSSLVKLTQLKSLQLLGMTSRCLRDVLRGLTAHITLTHLSFRGVAESDGAHDYRRMRSALDSMGLADQFVYPSTRQFVNADNTFGPYTIMSKVSSGVQAWTYACFGHS